VNVDLSRIDRSHVLQALAELDGPGGEASPGNRPSHVLVQDGTTYDAEVVLDVAHRCATGTAVDGAPGGPDAVRVLTELGFTVRAATDTAPDVGTPPRDASEVGWEAARAAWCEAARPALLVAARRYRATVTQRQLATAVQESTGITTTRPMQQWIGDVLGRVTEECQALGEPLLPALCVTAQGSVGEGYADAVERARGTRPPDPDGHAAEERLSCYRHWDATGLPSDGGTPLRTAHFTTVRKASSRTATPRTPAARTPAGRKPAARKPAAATAAAPAPAPLRLCPHCFTAGPATGVCDYCD
jgi:hypothetical protein